MRWHPRDKGFARMVRLNWTNSTIRHFSYSTCRLRPSQPSIANILATSPEDPPTTLTAVGFVRTIRRQKHFSFLELGDGSTIHPLQALLQPSHAHELVQALRPNFDLSEDKGLTSITA